LPKTHERDAILSELEDLAEVASRDVVLVVTDWRRGRDREGALHRARAGRDVGGEGGGGEGGSYGAYAGRGDGDWDGGGAAAVDTTHMPLAKALPDGVRVVSERGRASLRAWYEADAVALILDESQAAEVVADDHAAADDKAEIEKLGKEEQKDFTSHAEDDRGDGGGEGEDGSCGGGIRRGGGVRVYRHEVVQEEAETSTEDERAVTTPTLPSSKLVNAATTLKAAARQVGARAVFVAVESTPRPPPPLPPLPPPPPPQTTISWFGVGETAVDVTPLPPPPPPPPRVARVAPTAAAASLYTRAGLLDKSHVLSITKLRLVPSPGGYDEDSSDDDRDDGEDGHGDNDGEEEVESSATQDRGRGHPREAAIQVGAERATTTSAMETTKEAKWGSGRQSRAGVPVPLSEVTREEERGEDGGEGREERGMASWLSDIGDDALGATTALDDDDISHMLCSTASAGAWSRATPPEKAWSERVGQSLRATIAARARKLLAVYTPLRAVVRYWSVVAGIDPGDHAARVSGEAPIATAKVGTATDANASANANAGANAKQGGDRHRQYGSGGGDGDGGTSTSGYTATAASAAGSRTKHAADKARAVTTNTLGRILTGAVEGTPKIGFVGASALAAGHRRRDPALSTGWLNYLIYSDSVVSFTGGTLLVNPKP
jgi:hypothetical protein